MTAAELAALPDGQALRLKAWAHEVPYADGGLQGVEGHRYHAPGLVSVEVARRLAEASCFNLDLLTLCIEHEGFCQICSKDWEDAQRRHGQSSAACATRPPG